MSALRVATIHFYHILFYFAAFYFHSNFQKLKTTFLVWSLPSPTLYHFEETKTYPYIALTLPTSLKRIVPNYSVFVFS